MEKEELERELNGVTEMLAVVLSTIGEPVVVPKESLSDLDRSMQIVVDDDQANNTFVFRMESLSEQ